MEPENNLDPCFFCGKPSTGVFSLAHAPISVQMCNECSERELISIHNLIVAFTRNSGDLHDSIKDYIRVPKAQACWRGQYISIPEFYNRLDSNFLDEFYKNNPQNSIYKNAKVLLKKQARKIMLTTVLAAAEPFAKLNKEICGGKTLRIKDKFPSFKTRKKKIESWWNSLNSLQKFEVGEVALHYRKISPRYPWACEDHHKFSDLTKGQKKIVEFTFKRKNEIWHPFDLRFMLRF